MERKLLKQLFQFSAMAVLTAGCDWAQGKKVELTEVVIDCNCSDAVGSLYLTELRDAIARSPRYREVATHTKSVVGYFVISVVTDDDSVDSTGVHSALSVAYTNGEDVLISHAVQTCGRDVVAQCAARTIAGLDQAISNMRK